MRKLTLLGALAALLIFSSSAKAADVYGGSNTSASPGPVYSVNWSGVYVAAGVALEAQALGIEGLSGLELAEQNKAVFGRLGYRHQTGQFVVGVFGEIQASDLEFSALGQSADAEIAYTGGADFGIALGGLLLSAEGGYRYVPVEVGGVDVDMSGFFGGVKAAVDIGGGWELGVSVRQYFLSDEVQGVEIDNDTLAGSVSIGKRFQF